MSRKKRNKEYDYDDENTEKNDWTQKSKIKEEKKLRKLRKDKEKSRKI